MTQPWYRDIPPSERVRATLMKNTAAFQLIPKTLARNHVGAHCSSARAGPPTYPNRPAAPRAPTSNRYDFRFNPSVKAPASTSRTTSCSPTRGLQNRRFDTKTAPIARRRARWLAYGSPHGLPYTPQYPPTPPTCENMHKQFLEHNVLKQSGK